MSSGVHKIYTWRMSEHLNTQEYVSVNVIVQKYPNAFQSYFVCNLLQGGVDIYNISIHNVSIFRDSLLLHRPIYSLSPGPEDSGAALSGDNIFKGAGHGTWILWKNSLDTAVIICPGYTHGGGKEHIGVICLLMHDQTHLGSIFKVRGQHSQGVDWRRISSSYHFTCNWTLFPFPLTFLHIFLFPKETIAQYLQILWIHFGSLILVLFC